LQLGEPIIGGTGNRQQKSSAELEINPRDYNATFVCWIFARWTPGRGGGAAKKALI